MACAETSSSWTDNIAVAWRGTRVPSGALIAGRKLVPTSRTGTRSRDCVVLKRQVTPRIGRVDSSVPRSTRLAFADCASEAVGSKRAIEQEGKGRR